ncbi:MAG: hypothetical protein ABH878_02315 [bacterium]
MGLISVTIITHPDPQVWEIMIKQKGNPPSNPHPSHPKADDELELEDD